MHRCACPIGMRRRFVNRASAGFGVTAPGIRDAACPSCGDNDRCICRCRGGQRRQSRKHPGAGKIVRSRAHPGSCRRGHRAEDRSDPLSRRRSDNSRHRHTIGCRLRVSGPARDDFRWSNPFRPPVYRSGRRDLQNDDPSAGSAYAGRFGDQFDKHNLSIRKVGLDLFRVDRWPAQPSRKSRQTGCGNGSGLLHFRGRFEGSRYPRREHGASQFRSLCAPQGWKCSERTTDRDAGELQRLCLGRGASPGSFHPRCLVEGHDRSPISGGRTGLSSCRGIDRDRRPCARSGSPSDRVFCPRVEHHRFRRLAHAAGDTRFPRVKECWGDDR